MSSQVIRAIQAFTQARPLLLLPVNAVVVVAAAMVAVESGSTVTSTASTLQFVLAVVASDP